MQPTNEYQFVTDREGLARVWDILARYNRPSLGASSSIGHAMRDIVAAIGAPVRLPEGCQVALAPLDSRTVKVGRGFRTTYLVQVIAVDGDEED